LKYLEFGEGELTCDLLAMGLSAPRQGLALQVFDEWSQPLISASNSIPSTTDCAVPRDFFGKLMIYDL
jgi:hypothetical protein